ncbi:MAG TPA: hypothetical protein VIK07_12415 [Bacteroidales bacterium]
MENQCEVTPRPKTVREFFRSWYFWRPFIGVFAGGLVGFLYYHFIGCTTGSCAITSNPYSSILFGGFFGFFLTSSPCLWGKNKN